MDYCGLIASVCSVSYLTNGKTTVFCTTRTTLHFLAVTVPYRTYSTVPAYVFPPVLPCWGFVHVLFWNTSGIHALYRTVSTI